MGIVKCAISVSLDGYVAGPNQGRDNGLGDGGEQLHEWLVESESWRRSHGKSGGTDDESSQFFDRITANTGAVVMGRGMFGGGAGEWDPDWKGWWGENPPFGVPVFVLTHHPRDRIETKGGTTFEFVTDGIESALERARAAAGEADVAIGGGGSTVDQYLKAGLLDELTLHVVPIMLGAGSRLLADAGTPGLGQVEALAATGVTHLRFRVV